MNNFIHLKHEISLMSSMIRSNHDNIEVIMNNFIKNSNSSTNSNDVFNIDNILPLKSEKELKAFEENIKIDDFKTALVCIKICLFLLLDCNTCTYFFFR